jgi:hypothetical protein
LSSGEIPVASAVPYIVVSTVALCASAPRYYISRADLENLTAFFRFFTIKFLKPEGIGLPLAKRGNALYLF